MILIDTSILIEFFRARDKQTTRFAKLARPENRCAISVLTLFEVYKGMLPGQEMFWKELFLGLEILPFDITCSHAAAEIWKELRTKRINLDFLDLGIAATAVALRTELATLNIKHFEQIEGLELVTKYRKGE